jgi:hypothetical protein
MFAEAITAVANVITAQGYVPVTDPRNARPLTVFIELPTFDAFTYNVGDITLTIRVLAPPPGNQDAGDYLLTAIDALMNSSLAITGGQPTIAQIGSQELPAYDLTVRISSKRN